tara:strand:+ start:90 stop:254 length:165 start_codon:yes stop_codon:yes gene_type:complete
MGWGVIIMSQVRGRAGGHGVSFYMYIAVKDFLIVFITMQKKPVQSRGVPFGYPR